MASDLIDRFFAEECNDYVKNVLIREIASRSAGSRYLTFNAFNVLLDFDAGVITVDDELDAESTCSIPIAAFNERLGHD